jgi:hypothetical protein
MKQQNHIPTTNKHKSLKSKQFINFHLMFSLRLVLGLKVGQFWVFSVSRVN